jgi:hypothetical protein
MSWHGDSREQSKNHPPGKEATMTSTQPTSRPSKTRSLIAASAIVAALAAAGCGSSTVYLGQSAHQRSVPITYGVAAAPSDQQRLQRLDTDVRSAYAAKDWSKLCSHASTAAKARIAQQNQGMGCEQAMAAVAAIYPQPTLPALSSVKVSGNHATFTYADGHTSPAVLENGQWKTND